MSDHYNYHKKSRCRRDEMKENDIDVYAVSCLFTLLCELGIITKDHYVTLDNEFDWREYGDKVRLNVCR